MGIYFPKSTLLSNDDLQRMRQIYRESFLAELEHCRIVEQLGSGTTDAFAKRQYH